MIFTKDLPTDLPLSAFNNNVIEFHPTDEERNIVSCILTVDGNEFDITPNLSRNYRFNLYTLTKILTNLNNFKDEVEPDMSNGYIQNDNSLYYELSLNIKITFDDETFEEVTKDYLFVKSVDQFIRDKSFREIRLFPLLKKYNNRYSCTYFEGYPFDFSFYSNEDREITIINKTNGYSITKSITKGVNRLFLSDGENNISTLNLLPLVLNYNKLDFKIGNELLFSVIIRKIDAECNSFYLKFFNQSGSYSYWSFPKNKIDELRSRTLDSIDLDSQDLTESQSNFLITGKGKEEFTSSESQLLTAEEKQYLQEIFFSPNVEILNNERFAENSLNDFSTVKVQDVNLSFKSKNYRNRIPIKIELPKQSTQTL